MLSLKVINLFGAPGVGKSTTAAGLYNLMSVRGHSVELVSEFAKDLTWSKDWMGLSHQPTILAQQDYRLRRLEGQVEYAIVDSPLPCQIAYMGEEWLNAGLDTLAWSLFERYYNLNVLMSRNSLHKYQSAGRNQTHEEACILDNVMDQLFHTAILDDEDFSLELTADQQASYRIYNWVMESEGGE